MSEMGKYYLDYFLTLLQQIVENFLGQYFEIWSVSPQMFRLVVYSVHTKTHL
jgi:hypothetical protein